MAQLSQKVLDIIKKYKIVIFIVFCGLVFLLLPNGSGHDIVVLDVNGNYSHNCKCENKPPMQGDPGGWKWRSIPSGKTCPTNTQIPCHA